MSMLKTDLCSDLAQIESTISQLATKLEPVTEMNNTVGLSKTNMQQTMHLIKRSID